MTLALWAKNNSRNGCDLRAVEQDFSSFTTVFADATHVGQCVEGARRWFAGKSDLVQSRQEQITTYSILVSDLFESRVRFSFSLPIETIEAGLDSLRRNL